MGKKEKKHNTHVESLRAAPGVIAHGDIIERCRLLLEYGVDERVQEPEWGQAARESRGVEQSDEACDGGG